MKEFLPTQHVISAEEMEFGPEIYAKQARVNNMDGIVTSTQKKQRTLMEGQWMRRAVEVTLFCEQKN